MRTVPQRHVWGGRGGSRARGGGSAHRSGGTTNVYVPPNSSAGSDSLQGSPESDVGNGNGSAGPLTQGPPQARDPSPTASTAGSYIPPPPPGYAYSIVPASSPAAMIVSGPGGAAYSPYPLPSVQEGLPVSPREYDVQQDGLPWLMQGDSPDVPYMDATNSVSGDPDVTARSAVQHGAYPAHVALDSDGRGSGAHDSAYESPGDSTPCTEDDEVPDLAHESGPPAAAAMRSTVDDSGVLDSSFLGTTVNRPLMHGAAGPVAEQVRGAHLSCTHVMHAVVVPPRSFVHHAFVRGHAAAWKYAAGSDAALCRQSYARCSRAALQGDSGAGA